MVIRNLVLSAILVLIAGFTFAQDTGDLVRDGNFYMDRGDCSLAQFFFEEALAQDSENVPALTGLGRALRCQGANAEAVDALRRAIDLNDGDAEAYVQLALTYRAQFLEDGAAYATRLSDALDAVSQAERLAPRDPRVFNTKGVLLYQAGNLEEARAAFETASTLSATSTALSDREVSTIAVNQGRVYRDLGEFELARLIFRRAIVLDPTNAAARNLLGGVLFRLDNCEDAEYELSQAVTLAPSSLSAVSQLAITVYECGDPAASIPVFEQALELEGAVFTPPLYTYLARAYLAEGRVDDAVERAQQGALLPPEQAEAHFVLGQAYEARGATGDRAAARDAYRTALELDPTYQEAQDALDALN